MGALRRDLVRHVEHGDVDPVKGLGGDLLDHDILATDPQDPAGGTGGGEEANLAPDVRALAQDAEHDSADGAGRTDDRQGGLATAHRPVPP